MLLKIGLRDALGTIGLSGAFNGVLLKALFNLPYGAALYTTATGQEYSWAFWLATLVLYPLNTAKVAAQVTGNVRFPASGYRGVIPFALVNFLCAWQLTALFTPEKLNKIEEAARKASIEKAGFY